MRILIPLCLAAVVAACAAPGPAPEFTYYRLPPAPEVAARAAPLFDQTLVIDSVLAEGVYGEQPLLYSHEREGLRLNQYHYQLWAEPPTRMVQRRLIKRLGDAGLAPQVVDRSSGARRGLRISGLLRGFERVQTERGWEVRVAMQWRVEGPRGRGVIWLSDYEETEVASTDTIEASVRAFAVALDRGLARFQADLETLAPD